jgi:hypothetical protein
LTDSRNGCIILSEGEGSTPKPKPTEGLRANLKTSSLKKKIKKGVDKFSRM